MPTPPRPAPFRPRYLVAGSAVSQPDAIGCTESPRSSLSQLALLASTLVVLTLAGCGKERSNNGGLDPAEPGSLIVTVAGLPTGVDAGMTLAGPAGYSRQLSASETITGLAPGSYTLSAPEAEVDGDGYSGTPASQSILVRQGPASSSAAVSFGLSTGRLVVAVTGVPDGAASVQIIGPGGYNKTLTGGQTLKKLAPGNYAISAGATTVDGEHYQAPGSSQVIAVAVGATPPPAAAIDYLLVSGRLQLTVSGAPAGTTPAVAVTGPGGFNQALGGSQLLVGLAPGGYTIAATPLTDGGHTYQPTVAPGTTIPVVAGPVPAAASVGYAIATGGLTLTVAGLPAGVAGSVVVTGPGGYAHPVTATETILGLAPGSYPIAASNVVVGGTTYVPSVATQSVSVAAGTTPSQATVQYAVGVGNLSLTVSGLPGGVSAAVVVTGPNGYLRNVTGSQTLSSLAPGNYTVTATAVSFGGQTYSPSPGSQSKVVSIGATATASVSYAGTLGSLAVTVNGLPGGVLASVTVTGPGGFNQAVSATATLTGLAAGSYTVTAANVSSGGQTYNAAPASQGATVTAGATAAAVVNYAGTLGNLAVTIAGLPGGVAAAVTVTGPGGFNQILTATQTLVALAAGTYTITAANSSSGGTTYLPAPASQTAAVTAGATANRTVTYTATGALAITVTGLPGGTSASITVTGPGGYNQSVTASTTLTALTAGSYTVVAGNASSGGSTYGPAPTSQNVTVTGGATAAATVTYAILSGVTLNLQINRMYLTQAAAKYDGTTPVITGRDGYLRVFVTANQANTATPTVRVRFYSGAALVQTTIINAPGASVPTAVTEGTFSSSWNLLVSASLVQPNLRILADVDPTNAIAETDDADNGFPASGTPLSIDVKTVPTWNVRFVPVLQQANGLQGNVTAGNQAQFLADPLKMLPVAGYSADVRAVYTTTAPALQSGNGNGAWGTILNEVWALRTADASTRYYYGVVKTSYGGGVAGIGYVGGGINVSLGWDALPSGSGIMAHEVGHNMGRPHSPCGGASSPDPSYPYAGGIIGVYGLDLATLTVKAPSTNYDFMGYCSPDWVSDYTWDKMITYRQSNPNYGPPVGPSSTAVSGLLVWGRLTHAGVVLEPAFRVAPPSIPPTGSGRYRVEGLAASGAVLFSYPVEPVPSMTAGLQTDHEEHFATVLPLSQADDATLARVRLVTPAGSVERLSLQAVQQPGRQLFLRDPAASTTKPNAAQAIVRWDGGTYPMALVRDASTGEILSFARGGAATIWTTGRSFDVTFSDGVRSVARRLP